MYHFTKYYKKHLLVLSFHEFQTFNTYEFNKNLGLCDQERILLHKQNDVVAKFVVIKSFDTEKQAKDKIKDLKFEFKIIKNSEEELDHLLEDEI